MKKEITEEREKQFVQYTGSISLVASEVIRDEWMSQNYYVICAFLNIHSTANTGLPYAFGEF